MQMKKIAAILLTVCMSAGMLAGCGGSESTENNAEQNTPSAQEASGESVVHKEGFPIVDEAITLKVFGQQGPVQSK